MLLLLDFSSINSIMWVSHRCNESTVGFVPYFETPQCFLQQAGSLTAPFSQKPKCGIELTGIFEAFYALGLGGIFFLLFQKIISFYLTCHRPKDKFSLNVKTGCFWQFQDILNDFFLSFWNRKPVWKPFPACSFNCDKTSTFLTKLCCFGCVFFPKKKDATPHSEELCQEAQYYSWVWVSAPLAAHRWVISNLKYGGSWVLGKGKVDMDVWRPRSWQESH